MKLTTMDSLYQHELEDLLSVERQLVKALEKLGKAASDEALKAAFTAHLEETKQHAEVVEQLLKGLGRSTARIQKCKGIEGIIAEGEEIMKAEGDPDVKDAALISAAQRAEHYEMAGYGAAVAFAMRLGKSDDADALRRTLEGEKAADRKLTQIALQSVNPAAAEQDEETEESSSDESTTDNAQRRSRSSSGERTTMPRNDHRNDEREYSSNNRSRSGAHARDDDHRRDEDGRFTSTGHGSSRNNARYEDERAGASQGGWGEREEGRSYSSSRSSRPYADAERGCGQRGPNGEMPRDEMGRFRPSCEWGDERASSGHSFGSSSQHGGSRGGWQDERPREGPRGGGRGDRYEEGDRSWSGGRGNDYESHRSQGHDQARDEDGRFTSAEYGRDGSREASRYDERERSHRDDDRGRNGDHNRDQDRNQNRNQNRNQDRDEEGRFVSSGHSSSASRGASRYDEDNHRSSRSSRR
jgi:ferritin-like metal-binding protein YciE